MDLTMMLNVVLAIICVATAIYIMHMVEKNAALKKLNNGMQSVVQKSQKIALRRKKKEEELRIEDGSQEKTSFFYRVDLSLIQSGIAKKFPFVTTEVYLCLIAVTMAIAFVVGMKYSLLIAVIAASLSGFLYYVLIFVLCSINFRKTEEQILSFVDMMKSYSRTSDDIMTILQSVSVYMEEPLKSVIEECCMEVENTGDVSAAITRMGLKIEHKEFKKIMNNLEVCSRHKANYGEVIARNKEQLRSYIAAKEEMRRMVSSARMNILLILGVGVICFVQINQLPEEGMLVLMQQTFIGNCILFYLFFVVLWAIWKLISMGQKE